MQAVEQQFQIAAHHAEWHADRFLEFDRPFQFGLRRRELLGAIEQPPVQFGVLDGQGDLDGKQGQELAILIGKWPLAPGDEDGAVDASAHAQHRYHRRQPVNLGGGLHHAIWGLVALVEQDIVFFLQVGPQRLVVGRVTHVERQVGQLAPGQSEGWFLGLQVAAVLVPQKDDAFIGAEQVCDVGGDLLVHLAPVGPGDGGARDLAQPANLHQPLEHFVLGLFELGDVGGDEGDTQDFPLAVAKWGGGQRIVAPRERLFRSDLVQVTWEFAVEDLLAHGLPALEGGAAHLIEQVTTHDVLAGQVLAAVAQRKGVPLPVDACDAQVTVDGIDDRAHRVQYALVIIADESRVRSGPFVACCCFQQPLAQSLHNLSASRRS